MAELRRRTSVILLIEDNPDDEELTRMALAESKILSRIVVAQDGPEAIDYLFSHGSYEGRDPAFDPELILLDLKLPKLSGLEVLRRIRSEKRTRIIPVVVLTTSSEEEDIVASYQLGANSYVRKPVEFNQFAAAVKQIGHYWLLLNETPYSFA
jgi:two-component system response regulator